MALTGGVSKKFCTYCGALNTQRIGACKVCRLSVCESCGNIQYLKGERETIHDACLRKSGESFSMIKFVK